MVLFLSLHTATLTKPRPKKTMTRLSSEVPRPLGRATVAKNATRIRNWIEKAQFLKQHKLLPDTFPGLDAPALLLNLLAPHQEFLDVPTETARKIFEEPKLQPWLQHFHEKTSFTLPQPLPNESGTPPITLSYLASEDRTSHSYGIQWPQNSPIELLTAQVQQHETILFHLPTLQLQFAAADTIPQSYSGPPSFLRRLSILSATSLLTNPQFTAWASQVDETYQETTQRISSDLAIFMWAIGGVPVGGFPVVASSGSAPCPRAGVNPLRGTTSWQTLVVVPPSRAGGKPPFGSVHYVANPLRGATTGHTSGAHGNCQGKPPTGHNYAAQLRGTIANDPHVLAYESIQTQLTATNQLLQHIYDLELNIRASGFNLTTKDSTPLAQGTLSALFCNQKSASLVNTALLTNPLLSTPFRLSTQDFGQTVQLTTSRTKTYTSLTASTATSLTASQEQISSHHSLLAHLYNDYEAAGNLALSC